MSGNGKNPDLSNDSKRSVSFNDSVNVGEYSKNPKKTEGESSVYVTETSDKGKSRLGFFANTLAAAKEYNDAQEYVENKKTNEASDLKKRLKEKEQREKEPPAPPSYEDRRTEEDDFDDAILSGEASYD